MTATLRVTALALLVLYVVGLAAVLTEFNPAVATDVVAGVENWLRRSGAPGAFSEPGRVEFGLNALMFAPVALLASLVVPRHPWANWVVYAFVGSGAVELWQGLILPPRSAQMVDVVANTLGALLGSLVALPLTWGIARRSIEKV